MTSRFATSYSVTAPAWLDEALAELPETVPDHESRMSLVNALADRNYREQTGGPFAALVVESATGRIVSAGVNLVLESGLSSAHAEVVAISFAQAALGRWNLGEPGTEPLELVVNWRPCVMCYGATLWSGVRKLVVAGDGPELEALSGFDEGPMRDDWAAQFEARGIEVVIGVGRDEAIAVFEAYGNRDDLVVYNARGGDAG